MNQFSVRCKRFVWVIGMLGTLAVFGCGNNDGGGAAPGVLAVSMTDAPACGFDQVNVTVSKVRVHQSGSASENAAGWADITLNAPRKINLLYLNDPTHANLALESLGETPLAAGHYTQLRLVLVPNSNNPNAPLANSVVPSGQTTEIAVATPSGIQAGIKLINQFEVPPGQRVDLLLDFDACKSVVSHNDGTYALKPVIRVIPFVLNGIEGFVDKALLGDHVIVSAQSGGHIVRATVPNAATGKFFLGRLEAPSIYDVVITADDHATVVIAGVPVASSTSITRISTDVAPFSLGLSASQNVDGIVTLNPQDDEATVIVAAKQSLVGGPVVTVLTKVGTLQTGPPAGDYAYGMTLPTGAPALGLYSSVLPIGLSASAQTSVAGLYEMRTSAETETTSYLTQAPDPAVVNVAGGPATQNLTMTP